MTNDYQQPPYNPAMVGMVGPQISAFPQQQYGSLLPGQAAPGQLTEHPPTGYNLPDQNSQQGESLLSGFAIHVSP